MSDKYLFYTFSRICQAYWMKKRKECGGRIPSCALFFCNFRQFY